MTFQLTRSTFLKLSGKALMSLPFVNSAFADEETISKNTYTYKKAGNLEIKADVYRSNDDSIKPVVVSIHGGALIMGHREWILEPMQRLALESGYIYVSIDYRLAPETKLPSIIEDLEDAFVWIRNKGPALFKADASRIAVMGYSAGGYLTLTSGFRVRPRPRALVSFFGYGDLIGEWYSTPSKHRRHYGKKMTKEEAFGQVDGPPISDGRNRDGDGGAFYQHCRQHGIWPKAVSNWDPITEAEKFYPYMPLKNVTKDYPPTIFIHGDKDTDVPYEMSVMMADELKKHGVEHMLITIPGGEHGLDGGDPELIESAYKAAIDFVNDHMEM